MSLVNENSALLWHRRLGHISIKRIKRLVTDGVLKTLDFTDFGTCVDCLKEKQPTRPLNIPIGNLRFLKSYIQISVDLFLLPA